MSIHTLSDVAKSTVGMTEQQARDTVREHACAVRVVPPGAFIAAIATNRTIFLEVEEGVVLDAWVSDPCQKSLPWREGIPAAGKEPDAGAC